MNIKNFIFKKSNKIEILKNAKLKNLKNKLNDFNANI